MEAVIEELLQNLNQNGSRNGSQNRSQNSDRNREENLQIGVDDPLFMHSSDHSSLILVTDLLTERNYVSWSRAMKVALEARDKFGFLTGEIEAASMIGAKQQKQWRKVNSTLISWIMNAMSKEIGKGFVFIEDAKTLWEEIKEQFGGSNGPRVYELRKSIYTAKQGGDSVVMYFNRIRRLWDELAILKPGAKDQEERMMQLLAPRFYGPQ